MPRVVWNQLPERLTVLVPAGRTLDPPSPYEFDVALNEYESQAGFCVPASYREFLHWFGPGELSGYFQVCAPVPARFRGAVADVFDIGKQREMLQDPEGYWATSVDPERGRRLVLFAATGGGDWFFWDRGDMRDAHRREYGVYGHSQSNISGEVELMAPSFEAFVTEIGLGERYPFSKEQRSPQWTYWPAWPTKQA
jgi:hypothetical protein